MIKRHYYVGMARYTEQGQFCGNTWRIVTVKSWFPNPVGAIMSTIEGVQAELPDQQIHVTSVLRV